MERYNKRYPGRNDRAVRRIREDKMDFVREVAGAVCVDCGEDRPAALQYHHPGKRGNRGTLSNKKWEVLKEMVMHIVPLCGTCHNLHHREVV